jgi:hypothetical protein
MALVEGIERMKSKSPKNRSFGKYLYLPTAIASLGVGATQLLRPKTFMSKKASLEKVYDEAFKDELGKIAQYYQQQPQGYQPKAWHTVPAGLGIGAAYAAGTAVAHVPSSMRHQRVSKRWATHQKIRGATPGQGGAGYARLQRTGKHISGSLSKHLGRAKKLGIGIAVAGPALWAADKFLRGRAQRQMRNQTY